MTWILSQEERDKLNQKYQLNSHGHRNAILDSFMLKLRRNRPILSPDYTHSIFQSGDLVQLWFQTNACRFSKSGKCTVCNYWNGQRIEGLLEKILPTIVLPENCRTLLINSCGSCLDSNEMSSYELEVLLDWISRTKVPRVIFETHWTTITNDILKKIRQAIPGKIIFYEIGIESMNPDVLLYSLNKPSSLLDISNILHSIHSYGSQSIVNVLFGAPFLTPAEQAEDTLESIQKLLELKVDYIVVFPINLKPETLPEYLYKRSLYSPVPGKMLAEILIKFPTAVLPRINVAWFGDHKEEKVIPPRYCSVCQEKTRTLFLRYNDETKGDTRRQLLERIQNISCNCVPLYFSQNFLTGTAAERLDFFYSQILEYTEKELL